MQGVLVLEVAQVGAGRHVDAAPEVDPCGAGLVEDDAVGAVQAVLLHGEALHGALLEVDAVGVAAGGVVLVGIDEDMLALLVELDEALDLVLALGNLLHERAIHIIEIEVLVAVAHA